MTRLRYFEKLLHSEMLFIQPGIHSLLNELLLIRKNIEKKLLHKRKWTQKKITCVCFL